MMGVTRKLSCGVLAVFICLAAGGCREHSKTSTRHSPTRIHAKADIGEKGSAARSRSNGATPGIRHSPASAKPVPPGFRAFGRIVCDDEGKPLPGVVATDWAFEPELKSLESLFPEKIATAKTSADGSFRVLVPLNNESFVTYWTLGFAQGIDVPRQMNRKSGSRRNLEKSAPVTGRILDSTGHPLEHVTLRAAPSETKTNGLGFFTTNTATARDGRFRIDWLPKGPCAILALRNDVPVGVFSVDAPAENQEFRLANGKNYSGRVVQGNTNRPMPGFPLSFAWHVPLGAIPPRPALTHWPVRTTTTANGNFRLDGIPTGTLNLSPDSGTTDTYVVEALKNSVVLPDDRTTVPTVLHTVTGHLVYGSVVDIETSLPVSGVVIRDGARVRSPWFVRTDSNGRFEIPVMGNRLFVESDTCWVWKEKKSEGGSNLVPVPDSAREKNTSFTILMKPFPSIQGQVTDTRNRPVPGAVLSLDEYEKQSPVPVAADGTFQVPIKLPQFNLIASAPGYTTTITETERFVPGKTYHLYLERGLKLEGKVVDATTSRPAGNVTVVANLARIGQDWNYWTTQNSNALAKTETAPDGSFVLSNVARDYLSVMPITKTGIRRGAPLYLDGQRIGNRNDLLLAAVPLKNLSGIVKDTEGKPVSEPVNVYYSINRTYGSAYDQVDSDSNGTFQFRDIPSYPMTLYAKNGSCLAGADQTTAVISLKEEKTTSVIFAAIDSDTIDPVEVDSVLTTDSMHSAVVRIENPGIVVVDHIRNPLYLVVEIRARGYLPWEKTMFDFPESMKAIMERPGSVEGRVVDDRTGKALSGVSVQVESGKKTVTDKQGKFSFPSQVHRGPAALILKRDPDYLEQKKFVFVGNGEKKDAGDIPIHRAGEIAIRVVKGRDDKPVKGVTVKLGKKGDKSQVTDREGMARFFGVSDRDMFHVAVPELSIKTEKALPLGASDDERVIVLHAGTASVEGTVRSGGQPCPAFLIIQTTDKQSYQTQTVGPDGKFHFNNLREGSYLLYANSAQNRNDGRQKKIRLHEEESISIDMDLGMVRLKVLVIDEDKKPVEGASVSIEAGGRRDRGERTDASGMFDLKIPKTDEAIVQATTRNPDSFSDLVKVPIRETDSEVNVTLTLKQGTAHLHCLVLSDNDDRPIADAFVHLASKSGRDLSKSTDGDGQAEIRAIPPGDYVAAFSAHNYASIYKNIHIDEGQTLEDTEHLKMEGTGLSILLNSGDDRPVLNARCVLSSPKETLEAFMIPGNTDSRASNHYYFSSVPPGDWQLTITAPGFAGVSIPYTGKEAGQTVSVVMH